MSSTPTAVVTGGNRGIGYAVAQELVRKGYRVVLLARDRQRGETARSALEALGGSEVALAVGDLSELSGVRSAAQALLASCPRIDVLVHNAGIWPSRLVRGEHGLEQAFVTNHLAPFALNHLLEPRLLSSRACVVQVSAGLYVKGHVDLERTPTGADFHPLRTYADTKLCNLLLVPLFAQRWSAAEVRINAVHPGVVRTGLGDRAGVPGYLLKAMKILWKPPRTGAAPVVRLALGEAASDVTGRYFHIDKETPLAPVARDVALAQQLWAQALELSGLPRTASPSGAPDVA
ncbi:SDR family NAD(P)-dependent oxidoreductase [Streptomyces sp. HUCO-GS316]|uniref:SDR family NAD(P)-dependent oxidoreductase n=1 Tax=Streptomyces sp. HUCO-GS316 TaxID=2692198 RepID=UPI001369C839|nr:SDR family NAD(P)-dependent oxidoreductase [Streptomyces sp. HUCO-GS316]MXM68683.1 SDR family NAD(P)-dependent oxidoreductase [Streptomyces sp. HUCO-GS316]